MGATSVNINGTWREVTGVYQNLGGVWVVASADTVHITSSISSTINVASLLGAPFLLANDIINIVIDAGVTIIGTTGATGANGINANGSAIANCHNTLVGNGANGANGGQGLPVFDFTGISGKTFQIVNNGVIKNSNGGVGGNGGAPNQAYNCGVIYGGCGGAGGLAGNTVLNPSGNTINFIGNTIMAGSVGASGAHGSPASTADVCNCDCSCCFLPFALVTMYDNTKKPIFDVKIGDIVKGAFGEPNKVIYLQRPSGKNQKLYNVNQLVTTSEHGAVNGNRNGFNYVSMKSAEENKNTWHESIDAYGNVIKLKLKELDSTKLKLNEFDRNSTVFTDKGSVRAVIFESDVVADTLYHLILTGGSKTFCVDGVFVSGWCDTDSFLKYME